MTPRERDELRALVYQAYELRETPYLRYAVDAIVEWWELLPLTRYERAQERAARKGA